MDLNKRIRKLPLGNSNIQHNNLSHCELGVREFLRIEDLIYILVEEFDICIWSHRELQRRKF